MEVGCLEISLSLTKHFWLNMVESFLLSLNLWLLNISSLSIFQIVPSLRLKKLINPLSYGVVFYGGKQLLELGAAWRVGNGTTISVWHRLPCKTLFNPLPTHNTLSAPQFVDELIQQRNGLWNWNTDVLKQWFSASDVNFFYLYQFSLKICKTPLHGCLIWMANTVWKEVTCLLRACYFLQRIGLKLLLQMIPSKMLIYGQKYGIINFTIEFLFRHGRLLETGCQQENSFIREVYFPINNVYFAMLLLKCYFTVYINVPLLMIFGSWNIHLEISLWMLLL